MSELQLGMVIPPPRNPRRSGATSPSPRGVGVAIRPRSPASPPAATSPSPSPMWLAVARLYSIRPRRRNRHLLGDVDVNGTVTIMQGNAPGDVALVQGGFRNSVSITQGDNVQVPNGSTVASYVAEINDTTVSSDVTIIQGMAPSTAPDAGNYVAAIGFDYLGLISGARLPFPSRSVVHVYSPAVRQQPGLSGGCRPLLIHHLLAGCLHRQRWRRRCPGFQHRRGRRCPRTLQPLQHQRRRR